MEDLKILTESVCCIAREAGYFLKEERKNFSREAVQKKQAHDYVSYVDKESEKRVVAALRELLPEAGFIAEEGSAVYHDEPYCWVVDPLDGTTNYIHDNAPYCVSIALRDKQFIDEESAKIEQWAEDQTFSLEEELRDVKKRIKEREREFRKETDDHRRRQLQTEIINLQRNQRQKRQEMFSLEDEIIVRRDALIAAIDSSLDKAAEEEHLFTIAWQVV